MANTLENQPHRYDGVGLWSGRPVVVLQESDGDDVYFHGVVMGPVGMSTASALGCCDQALAEAMVCEDEWNYDDVHEHLKDLGFEFVPALVWDEHFA